MNKQQTNPHIRSALANWIPIRLRADGPEEVCQWLYLAQERFLQPFFDDTISVCLKQPENSKGRKVLSTLSVLPEWGRELDTVPPAALIFHVSRCGSTLLSQFLSLQKENIVLSEVPFLDELLRRGFRTGQTEETSSLLEAALCFYGAKRFTDQERLFIKTDSWHIHFYRQWRERCPDIPFLLLYRRPDEIIRSQQKRRGMQAIPGLLEPALFGFDPVSVTSLHFDEYMARVLETYYSAFLDVAANDPNAVLCNYGEGMVTVYERLLRRCGITPDPALLEEVRSRGNFHGKYPGQRFEEDALEADIPAYLQPAFDLYHRLETLRLKHRPTS